MTKDEWIDQTGTGEEGSNRESPKYGQHRDIEASERPSKLLSSHRVSTYTAKAERWPNMEAKQPCFHILA